MSDQWVIQVEKRGVMYYLIGGTQEKYQPYVNRSMERTWTANVDNAHQFDNYFDALGTVQQQVKKGKIVKVENIE